MIVIRVIVKVKPEEKTNFVNHLKQEAIEVMDKFVGCEKFGLYTDVTDGDAFLLYEEWQSQANFDIYKNSDYFKQNGQKLFPMMVAPPDTAYFAATVIQ